VAQEIADSLQAKLSPTEASTLAAAPTTDPVAYDLFLKAEFEERLADTSLTADSFDQAAAWYRQAITRDPTFALAMARLVQNRIQRHWFIEQMTEPELANLWSADMAGNLGQTYGLLRMWKEAEGAARHAISLDPHDVIGMRALLLTILNGRGDINEAQNVLATFPPDNKLIIISIAADVGSVI